MQKKYLSYIAALALMAFVAVPVASAQAQGGPFFGSDSSGYGGNKVTLCFKGKTLTVGAPAARVFFARGATPGACGTVGGPVVMEPGSISGTTYLDPKGKGKPNQFQKFMYRRGGVTVFIDSNDNGELNAGEQSTVSDIMGDYTFSNLPSGMTYHIREVVPAGFTETYPPDMAYHEPLASGEDITYDDFANIPNSGKVRANFEFFDF